MTYRVSFRPQARLELEEIRQIIATDNPMRAARYVERIYKTCLSLSEMPLRGPARNEIARGLRILTFERRVVIAYRVHERTHEVEIVNVFYGGRDYEAWLRRHYR